jgi:hypothetical protein
MTGKGRDLSTPLEMTDGARDDRKGSQKVSVWGGSQVVSIWKVEERDWLV